MGDNINKSLLFGNKRSDNRVQHGDLLLMLSHNGKCIEVAFIFMSHSKCQQLYEHSQDYHQKN